MDKIIVLVLSFIFISCGDSNMYRKPAPGFGFTTKEFKSDETSLEYQMQMALLANDKNDSYNRVEALLKAGANPDKKTGQFKWIDTNPLWNCCRNEKFLKLFISYGADVKKRPYIAKLLTYRILSNTHPVKEWLEFHNKHPQVFISTENEIYNCVKILLENGADSCMKAISGNKVLFPASDWNYRRYNNKHGNTPINYAIECNLISVFNLLLEYGAKLDEKSLEIAKQTTISTGSDEMEKLVIAQLQKN